MNNELMSDSRVGGALRAFEESVEAANLLALELVIGALERGAPAAELSCAVPAADRAARATGEMARLLRETGLF
jgi:hypothetical protein